MGHRLGDLRVEWLGIEVERFETVLLELGEHHVQQRPDLVGVTQVRRLGGVEHRQERLGQPTGCPIDVVLDLVGGALAIVLEVGLDPHHDVLVLIALGDHGIEVEHVVRQPELGVVDVGDIAVTEPGRLRTLRVGVGIAMFDRRHLARVVIDLGPAFVVRLELAVGVHDGSPSSTISASTISASTMSSSLTEPAPSP